MCAYEYVINPHTVLEIYAHREQIIETALVSIVLCDTLKDGYYAIRKWSIIETFFCLFSSVYKLC